MRSPCENPECRYQDTGLCARRAEFSDPENQCPDLIKGRQRVGVPPYSPSSSVVEESEVPAGLPPDSGDHSRFWSGLALGSQEASDLLWNTRSKLITIMGEKNSGKTCFLTALYIQLANGFSNHFPYCFAGSQTLRGFQKLTDQAFQWRGGESRILPRTAQSNHREPSFLHLALRERNRWNVLPWHLLLTDMPGEWFQNWVNDSEISLRDTLEFLPRSDGFLVTIDAPKLIENRVYKENQGYLLGRIAALLKQSPFPQRPIALVLTKFDRLSPQSVRLIPSADQSNNPASWDSLEKPVAWLVEQLDELPEQTPWKLFPCAAFSKPARQPVGVFAPIAFLLEHMVNSSPLPLLKTFHPVSMESKPHRFFAMFREGGSHD